VLTRQTEKEKDEMNRHLVANILMTADALSHTHSLSLSLDLKVKWQIGNVTIDMREHPISPESTDIYGLIPYRKISSIQTMFRPTSCSVIFYVGQLDIDVLNGLRDRGIVARR
jgi:hypothetical protein